MELGRVVVMVVVVVVVVMVELRCGWRMPRLRGKAWHASSSSQIHRPDDTPAAVLVFSGSQQLTHLVLSSMEALFFSRKSKKPSCPS
jgi:hypothetical protein